VRRSLNAGVRQPWVVGATARSVTARLASMAGITVDDRLWQTVSGGDDLVQPNAYAEQSATIARLSQELMEAQAQVDWTEYTLHRLRRSHAYRLGRAMLNPARAVYNRVHHRIR
jgi:hypothetical protein